MFLEREEGREKNIYEREREMHPLVATQRHPEQGSLRRPGTSRIQTGLHVPEPKLGIELATLVCALIRIEPANFWLWDDTPTK